MFSGVLGKVSIAFHAYLYGNFGVFFVILLTVVTMKAKRRTFMRQDPIFRNAHPKELYYHIERPTMWVRAERESR